ncbi:gamma-glutamyltransferase family protein [Celeribacter indicus]|uniref:Gamma-glutamyltransferase n=1 Tax=Celeribacter indicus TaxID=1208324 RepID=A0A0B5E0E0_9RHOB|nr:gamma-glutamyltransferase [Celeribacter indicus]AJE46880.1 gamma-glutamyltransferase [Celeribacter indicus]SDW79591.1 gamma-glutamyltransferase 2. Threonine peptidase. MEROPS family T03 [Celeribacter indicus]
MATSDTPAPHSSAAATEAVATGHPLAAQAAMDMLARGGTAVDAAIAADAILGVVEPMATGLGGDSLAMLLPPGAPPLTYNGTGRSPSALSPDHVADLPGGTIPERHPYSVTVPGLARGWADLHGRFGRLPLADLLAPAIRLAREGFAVAPVCAREWQIFAGVIRSDPASNAIYSGDAIPEAGARFANPALAGLLEAIATEGPDAFYAGPAAAAVERAAKARGALLTAGDLAAHAGFFDRPLRQRFKGIEVLECPPNTHGTGVLKALETLDPLPLPMADPHTMVEVVKATRDGMRYARDTVADPSGNTVCTAVVDRDGFAVTLMSSVFKRFGSGIGVPELGICLQNRGHGFSAPGHINGVAGGRRPYHTVIPAAALKDGRFHAVFGVVGGLMQPQGHVQMMLRLAAWGQEVQAAIDAPRWRLEDDRRIALEPGSDPAFAAALAAAGFEEATGAGELGGRSDFGGAQIVMRAPDGGLVAGSDPRKDGTALLR